MTKILYVEDNPDNVYMLTRRLKKKGFELVIAGDGQEDRVEDFELGIDKIDISLWGVTSFSDSGFSIYEAANGQGDPLGRLVIEFGGDRIRLDGLATPDIPALDESHFIFA